MKAELMLNEIAYKPEDYDAIKQAIKSLSESSQEQFEEIKKEKWYNRVFDMITFSQKGKKRLAEQISTVAQAQQIFVELLLRIASDDEKVSKIVAESMGDIRRIQEQNIYLLSKINQLENISLGIRTDMDINKLSDKHKQVLTACLHKMSDMNIESSEKQKNYANAVTSYLGVDVQMDNPTSVFDAMDVESKKRIFACCMEYVFLRDCTFDEYGEYEEFIEEFDLGNKTVKSIKEQILSLYHLRGCEGFYSKYKADNFKDIEDTFFVDIELQEEAEEDEWELTDENIVSILPILPGETKTYINKKLHINAFVNCEGILSIERCILYYNESDTPGKITLGKGAHLTIKDSVVICKGCDEPAFISTSEGENTISFEKTTFVDCSFFLESRNKCSFSMIGCELRNCYDKFIYMRANDEALYNISENVILQERIAVFQRSKWGNKCIITIDSYKNAKIQFYNNTIIEKPQFKTVNVGGMYKLSYFSCQTAEVSKCTFIGLSSDILALRVKNSVFKNCTEAIRTFRLSGKKEDTPIVNNCIFENSTNVIVADRYTEITYCQFMDCYDNFIRPSSPSTFGGGVTVEFCEFRNIKNEYEGYVSEKKSCIALSPGSSPNYIKKCIFDGVELNKLFLISAFSAYGHEKPSGTVTYIQECTFKNCSTKCSSQVIIKEYMEYDSWGRKKNFHANKISDCRGLENVNKEGSVTKNTEMRTETADGVPIGSSFATGIITSQIGAPKALCTLAGVEGDEVRDNNVKSNEWWRGSGWTR